MDVTAKRTLQTLADMPERTDEARTLFLLHVANAMLRVVKAKAPDIPGTNYPKSLKIGVVDEGTGGWDSVMIYAEGEKQTLSENMRGDYLMWVRRDDRGGTLDILASHNPWPLGMLGTLEASAHTFIRRFSADVVEEIRMERATQVPSINRALADAGRSYQITPGAVEGESHLDLGHEVLRLEFGVGDRVATHWRPGLRAVKDAVASGRRAVVRYLQTGSMGGFDLPEYDSVTSADTEKVRAFQERITP